MKRSTFVLAGLLLSGLPLLANAVGVPVDQEIHHIPVFDNDRVRVYEVQLAPGESTDFHIHTVDQLSLVLAAPEGSNQIPGEAPVPQSAPTGTLIYSPYSRIGPFTHKIAAGQSGKVHVLGIALKGPNGGESKERMQLPSDIPFTFPQGSAINLALAPGESRALPAGLAIALAEGQLAEQERQSTEQEVRPGSHWWLTETTTLTNSADTPLPLLLVTFEP